jgi:hypothetical protein
LNGSRALRATQKLIAGGSRHCTLGSISFVRPKEMDERKGRPDGANTPSASRHFAVKRDNSGGRIWEWYDEGVKENDIPLFEKLISSKKTIIRYNGDKYYFDQILSDRDKRAMRKVFDAYRLLSGNNA